MVQAPDGQRNSEAALLGRSGCSSEAELHALVGVLELAWKQGARRLVVRGDSAVAIAYVNGSDHTGIERLAVLIRQAQLAAARFDEISLQWVPRHRNAEADALSRQAFGLAPKVPRLRRRRR